MSIANRLKPYNVSPATLRQGRGMVGVVDLKRWLPDIIWHVSKKTAERKSSEVDTIIIILLLLQMRKFEWMDVCYSITPEGLN